MNYKMILIFTLHTMIAKELLSGFAYTDMRVCCGTQNEQERQKLRLFTLE